MGAPIPASNPRAVEAGEIGRWRGASQPMDGPDLRRSTDAARSVTTRCLPMRCRSVQLAVLDLRRGVAAGCSPRRSPASRTDSETIRGSGALARRGNRFAGTTLFAGDQDRQHPAASSGSLRRCGRPPADAAFDEDQASRIDAMRRSVSCGSRVPCVGARRQSSLNSAPAAGRPPRRKALKLASGRSSIPVNRAIDRGNTRGCGRRGSRPV